MPEVLEDLCSEAAFHNPEPGSEGKRVRTDIIPNHNGVIETRHAIGKNERRN